jgi:hypothetical protein
MDGPALASVSEYESLSALASEYEWLSALLSANELPLE